MPPKVQQACYRGPAAPQRFSIQAPLMNNILKNATHDMRSKIYKSCKWYYAIDPVVFCRMVDGGICCDDARCLPGHRFCQKIRLSVINAKVDLNGPLYIKSTPSYEIVSTKLGEFCEKMFERQLPSELHIDLPYAERVMLEEAAFVAAHATIVDFDCRMIGTAGNDAKIEEVVSKMIHVESFSMKCTAATFGIETMGNLTEMDLSNLNFFKLYDIPPNVNLHDVMRFIKTRPEAVHHFYFDRNFVPDEATKNTLELMIDFLLFEEDLKFLIKFNSQDTERLKEMKARVA